MEHQSGAQQQSTKTGVWVNRILSPIMSILLIISIFYEYAEPRENRNESYFRIGIYLVLLLNYGWKTIQSWRNKFVPSKVD
jgi:hypothetical protein